MSVKELVLDETSIDERNGRKLVLWNDDFNTFDWVIESLIDVCNHTAEQAEQCAVLVHYKGKCAVSEGDDHTLMERRRALVSRGLSATVE